MAHPRVSEIENQVKDNKVMIYMKGTPDFPMCGFSARAVQVLRAAGVQSMGAVNVLEDDELWTALEEYSEWPTVPQIFIGGKFIGGSDIVMEMMENGELKRLLS